MQNAIYNSSNTSNVMDNNAMHSSIIIGNGAPSPEFINILNNIIKTCIDSNKPISVDIARITVENNK